MESDEECQHDSTWEDESQKETTRKNKTYSRRSRRNPYAAKDMQEFRHRCRKTNDDEDEVGDDASDGGNDDHPNLNFYRGQIASLPDDVYIDEYHEHWEGEYDKLEDVHSYIQWLFPIQEKGMNWKAKELTKNEIELFRNDKQAKHRLVKSYRLMLDFYGIRLVDESTGEVERTPKWKQRFLNLNRHSHNNLRITRILKCLGTLGLQHYQAPLVKFFLCETLIKKELPRVKQSVLDYFMFAVLDKSERKELIRFAYEHYSPREDFVWGPKKILSKMLSDGKGVGEQKEERVGNDHDITHISDSGDDRNSPRVENEENISSGDQGTYCKKEADCHSKEDEHGNNAEDMQIDQVEIKQGSNDNNQCSLEDNVGNPNPQTKEESLCSQDSNQTNGNVDQITDRNESDSPEELTQSKRGDEDSSISEIKSEHNKDSPMTPENMSEVQQEH